MESIRGWTSGLCACSYAVMEINGLVTAQFGSYLEDTLTNVLTLTALLNSLIIKDFGATGDHM